MGKAGKSVSRFSLVMVLVLSGSLTLLRSGVPAYADAAGKGGDFVPVNAVLLDTRNGTGGVTGVRGANSVTAVNALGVGSIPATGVSALMVDVTTISPTANTSLTVYPDQTTRPTATSLSASTGETLSNSAVVKVGANGKLAIHNQAGNVHIKLDVQGYFTATTGSAGSGFVAVKHMQVFPFPLRPKPCFPKDECPPPPAIANGATVAVDLSPATFPIVAVPSTAKAVLLDVAVARATASGTLTVGVNTASSTTVDYRPGATSMAMSVRLKGDGSRSINITNQGSAVDVTISVQGYFTDQPTTGAGLRPISAGRVLDTRVGSNVPIAANGGISVGVGGSNGLPTRGVAAVVLNVTAVSPTATGLLHVGPGWFGAPETLPPRGTSLHFNSGQGPRSSLVVAMVDGEGRVSIGNDSDGTVHLVVDVQGWFADPVTPLPVATYSKSVALQAQPAGTANGTVEYAYVNNLGQLRIGHQADPNDFSGVQWTVVSGLESFTGQPALHQPGGKPVQVSAQHTSGTIWGGGQTAAGAATWDPLTDFGGSMAGTPTATTVADGTGVLFDVDIDGRLWHYRQSGTGPSWKSLGNAGLVGKVTAERIEVGLRIIGTTATGAVKTAVYTNDGGLSTWTDLGGTVAGTPAAVVYPGYRTAIFARASDGSVVSKRQDAAGVWSTVWEAVGAQVAAGPPAAILDPVLGRTAVVVRGADNEIYRVFETAPGSGAWGNWEAINSGFSDPAATDPTVALLSNGSGSSWMIVYRNVNDATRVYDRQILPSLKTASPATEAPANVRFQAHTLPAPPA
ncbi:hypothetical protein [Micromonospora okii]|uniref:hypothetical protein n=1 Tax=Micromonospora okii TaxID=1182970 RepID=UPI001E4CAB75|nr:hypothetical protein [Micromonospora okii]